MFVVAIVVCLLVWLILDLGSYKVSHARNDNRAYIVAEWIHFTLFGIIIPTIKLKV